MKVLLYDKIKRFANKFESCLFEMSWSEKASLFIFFLFFIFLFFPKLQRKYKQNIKK